MVEQPKEFANGKHLLKFVEEMELKTVSLPAKKIVVDSLTQLVLIKNEHEQLPIELAKSGKKDLLEYVGLTQASIERMEEAYGESAGLKLISLLMDALSKKNENVILLRHDGKITRIVPESKRDRALQKDKMLEILYYVLDNDPNLVIDHVFVNPEEAKFSARIYNNNRHVLPFDGEDVCTGISLAWSGLEPTEIRDYVLRLVCSNGMVGERLKNTKNLTNISTAEQWQRVLFDPIQNDRLLQRYTADIRRAMEANLSIAEFDQVKKHCMANYAAESAYITRELGDERWRQEYIRKGLNPENMTAAQLANCPTPVNAWDALNLLTYLASHRLNADVRDRIRDKTQFFAGQLLKSDWNSEGWVYDIPRFENPRFSEPESVEYVGDLDKYNADTSDEEE